MLLLESDETQRKYCPEYSSPLFNLSTVTSVLATVATWPEFALPAGRVNCKSLEDQLKITIFRQQVEIGFG